MNDTTGQIDETTEIPRFADGLDISDLRINADYWTLESQDFWQEGTAAAAGNRSDYLVTATDAQGRPITTGDFTGSMSFTRLNYGGETYYQLKIVSGDGSFLRDGEVDTSGTINKCYNLVVSQCVRTRTVAGVDPTSGGGTGGPVYADSYAWVAQNGWRTDKRMTVIRDVEQNVEGQKYGFIMTVKPSVCEKCTTLDINLKNTSLVGFADNGKARTSDSEVKTRVMVSNQGQQFVIGGVEKKELVRSVSKVPWLGDIPLVGWALGSESESTKKTQLVTVLECRPSQPDTRISSVVEKAQRQVDGKTVEAGETNDFKNCNFGFDQFQFDREKLNFDPLP
jgi:hypothetical protein